jgi:hypothetical protein
LNGTAHIAWPLFNATALHSAFPAVVSVKVTAPVGLVAPVKAGAMVAVKVTIWSTTGFAEEETRLVDVEAAVTFCPTVAGEPARKLVSPLWKVAVTV